MEKIPFWKTLNNYRAFPRMFSLFFVYLTWYTTNWFMGLATPSLEQATFVTTMVATGAAFFKFYVTSGPNSSGKSGEN
jgi:hypothetical protein